MPRLADLPEMQRTLLANRAVPEHDTCPATDPVPAARATVAVVTTAGLHRRGDRPFVREDPGFRTLPADLPAADLVQSHSSIGFDRTATQRDPNVVLPLDRLPGLVADGTLGRLAPTWLSFMGAQADPEATLAASGSEAAQRLRAEGVDVVLLTPT